MDQNPLKQTAEEITIANLRSLLQVQTGLRDQAEKRAHEALVAFQDLLQTLLPEETEKLHRAGGTIESLPLSQLAEILKARSRQIVSDLAKLQRPQIENAEEIITKAYRQNTLLRGDLRRIKEALAEAVAENNRLRSENEAYKKSKGKKAEGEPEARRPAVAAAPPPPIPADLPSDEPEWMVRWRASKHFDQDAQALQLVGRTGLARRPEIERELGKLFNVGENSSTQPRVIQRLEEEQGLVRVERPFQNRGSSSGGSHPNLILLTDRGRQAYRLLTGKDAVPSEFERLQPAHVSPEHTILNIEVAEYLQREGYSIVSEAMTVDLPGGGKFMPDLVAQKDEETYFIEVERGGSKDTGTRQTKWLNFYTASAGQIFVVCDNLDCMRAIRKELLDALGPHRAAFALTNMAQLKNGERGKDGSIWLDRRRGHVP